MPVTAMVVGFVANLYPEILAANNPLQLRNDQFGWIVEAVAIAAFDEKTTYAVSVYDEASIYYVDDLQLLVSAHDLSWRKRK